MSAWTTRRRFMLGVAGSVALFGCRRARESRAPLEPDAELVVLGTIHTNDPRRGVAGGLAVAGGRISFVGSREQALERVSRGTELIDLAASGGAVLPGLSDAHAHLVGLGQSLEIVDLRNAESVAEVVQRLRDQAPPIEQNGGWILGRGWDQNRWGGAMPTRAALDEVFPDRPVWLRRIDGHAGWANGKALALAGIDAGTSDPEGGEILRGADGAPTGVLIDTAMDRVPIPEPSEADLERWLRAATHMAARAGLTSVHEMGLGPVACKVLERLAGAGELPLRVHGYASEDWWNAGLDDRRAMPVEPSDHFVLAGVKVYVDGALGSRGAALLEPYSDRPDHRGMLMHERSYFAALTEAALERGFQVAAHAIGDLGNRTIIDAYAQALACEGSATRPPRHCWKGEPPHERSHPRLRIEHVQIIDPADIPRMAELGLVASMQPTHATSDMPWAPARVGEARLAGAYAWRRMLEAGVPLAFGSDFPVEEVSPLLGLHAAVTRQDRHGQPPGGWLPEQRVTLAEAIAGFTSGAAFAAQREDHLGMLAPGYRADMTLLARDPYESDPSELPDLEVLGTLVDGQALG